MWDKILNPCYGKFSMKYCEAWSKSLSYTELGIAVFAALFVVFIIFRIWHFFVGDLEIW